MRLGLALGKTRSEIRNLPAPEYRDWELFYMLEPWGWVNEEYLTSKVVAMIQNVNVPEKNKKDRKPPVFFMRKMFDEISKVLNSEIIKHKEQKRLENMTLEERRDYWLPIVKHDMGVK